MPHPAIEAARIFRLIKDNDKNVWPLVGDSLGAALLQRHLIAFPSGDPPFNDVIVLYRGETIVSTSKDPQFLRSRDISIADDGSLIFQPKEGTFILREEKNEKRVRVIFDPAPGALEFEISAAAMLMLIIGDGLLGAAPEYLPTHVDGWANFLNSIARRPYTDYLRQKPLFLDEIAYLAERVCESPAVLKIINTRDSLKYATTVLIEIIKDQGMEFQIPRTPAEVLFLIYIQLGQPNSPLWSYVDRQDAANVKSILGQDSYLSAMDFLSEGKVGSLFRHSPSWSYANWLTAENVESRLHQLAVDDKGPVGQALRNNPALIQSTAALFRTLSDKRSFSGGHLGHLIWAAFDNAHRYSQPRQPDVRVITAA